jgi:hypothetical protein
MICTPPTRLRSGDAFAAQPRLAAKQAGASTQNDGHGAEVKRMALFGSVSGKEVDLFAKGLAVEIARQYPPALDNTSERNLSEKRLARVLETVCMRALEFKNEHKLGVYKKARLGNTFRWELEALGFSKKLIETATEGLVVYLTRKS